MSAIPLIHKRIQKQKSKTRLFREALKTQTAFERFIVPKLSNRYQKKQEILIPFHDFPAEYDFALHHSCWKNLGFNQHIIMSSPIETSDQEIINDRCFIMNVCVPCEYCSYCEIHSQMIHFIFHGFNERCCIVTDDEKEQQGKTQLLKFEIWTSCWLQNTSSYIHWIPEEVLIDLLEMLNPK
jgi:hypothetical protein